jgi:hypothetical protein
MSPLGAASKTSCTYTFGMYRRGGMIGLKSRGAAPGVCERAVIKIEIAEHGHCYAGGLKTELLSLLYVGTLQ